MAEVSIYLVPKSPVSDPRAVRVNAIRLLQTSQIIDTSSNSFYPKNEKAECFNVGDRNLDAFEIDEDNVDVSFQTCEIYGHPTVIDPSYGDTDSGLGPTSFFIGFHDTSGYSCIKPEWLVSFAAELGIELSGIEHWST